MWELAADHQQPRALESDILTRLVRGKCSLAEWTYLCCVWPGHVGKCLHLYGGKKSPGHLKFISQSVLSLEMRSWPHMNAGCPSVVPADPPLPRDPLSPGRWSRSHPRQQGWSQHHIKLLMLLYRQAEAAQGGSHLAAPGREACPPHSHTKAPLPLIGSIKGP